MFYKCRCRDTLRVSTCDRHDLDPPPLCFWCRSLFRRFGQIQGLYDSPAAFLFTPFHPLWISPLWMVWWGWRRRRGARHHYSAVSACTSRPSSGTCRKQNLRSAALGGRWVWSTSLTARILGRSEASGRALTLIPPPSAERNGLTALALNLHQPALYVPSIMCDRITAPWLGKWLGKEVASLLPPPYPTN